MNEQNDKLLETRKKALETVDNMVKSKENGVFSPVVEYNGKEYPNTFVVGTKDVLASELKETKEFIDVIVSFKGNPDYYEDQTCTISVKNGKVNKEWKWEEITELPVLEPFSKDARGQIFFYARALCLQDKLSKEVEELKG